MSAGLGEWGSAPTTPPPPPAPAASDAAVSITDVLDRAAGAVERAETRARAAAARVDAARVAVDDARGALQVAEQRLEAYTAGAEQEPWRVTALSEDVAKVQRRLDLATAQVDDRLAEQETAAGALERARDALARKQSEMPPLLLSGASGAAGEPEPEPVAVYANVADFVAEYLLPLYRRKTSTWCSQWWKHPEAVVRLQALWLSWEQLRQDPALGLSVWLRDHLDHHMPVLLSTDGPLKGCRPGIHRGEREVLAHEAPPAGLYQDERSGTP